MTKSFDDLEDAGLVEKLKSIDRPVVVDAVQVASQLVRKRRGRRRRRLVGVSVIVSSCLLLCLAGFRSFVAPEKPDSIEVPRVALSGPLQDLSADIEIDFAGVDQQLSTSAVVDELLGLSEIEKTQRDKIAELKKKIELSERNRDRYRWSALREIASRKIQ